MNWLSGLWNWVDQRLPVQRAWDTHMGKYYAPKNFNFWYFFGVLSLLVLVIQLVSGIWLLMSYNGTAEGAFASVEYIMRDVDYGWPDSCQAHKAEFQEASTLVLVDLF